MNKTKIIVVEDNIVYCEYVCNMLSREGYRNMKAYPHPHRERQRVLLTGRLPHREGLPPLNREETSATGNR